MHTIIVDRECGCFRRSDLENNVTFESKDDALMKASSMQAQMNEKFCGKHKFQVSESGNDFVISMGEAPRAGGCCGGGHCS